METHTMTDPAQFADALRTLAYDAHRTLRQSPSPTALCGLHHRVAALQSALDDRESGPLATWLHNLGREIRSAATHRPRPASPRPSLCRPSAARGQQRLAIKIPQPA
jgi:hypothetical protein